jgi:hypothetical protein
MAGFCTNILAGFYADIDSRANAKTFEQNDAIRTLRIAALGMFSKFCRYRPRAGSKRDPGVPDQISDVTRISVSTHKFVAASSKRNRLVFGSYPIESEQKFKKPSVAVTGD